MHPSDHEGVPSLPLVFRIFSLQADTGRIVHDWTSFLAESAASVKYGIARIVARANAANGLTVEVSFKEQMQFRIKIKQGDALVVLGELPADRRVEDELPIALGHAIEILAARKDVAAILTGYDKPLTRQEYEAACRQHGVEMLTADEERQGGFSYQYAPVENPLMMEIRKFLARRRLDAVQEEKQIAHFRQREAFMQQCEEAPSLEQVLANKDDRAHRIIRANFEVLPSRLNGARPSPNIAMCGSELFAFLEVGEDGGILNVTGCPPCVEVRFGDLGAVVARVVAPCLSSAALDIFLSSLKAWAHAHGIRWHRSASWQCICHTEKDSTGGPRTVIPGPGGNAMVVRSPEGDREWHFEHCPCAQYPRIE